MNASDGIDQPPTGLRARTELEAEYAAALAERAAFHDDAHRLDRARAVIDALGWILGHTPTAPMTGRTYAGPVTNIDTRREITAALDVLYGHRLPRHDARRPYAAGVEHALLWASYVTLVPPITRRR